MSYRDSAQEIINFADRGALAICINNGVEFLLGVETDDAVEGDKVDFCGEDKEYRISCIMHGCDRFDVSRGRLRVASRSPSATSPPNYVLRRMRCNPQYTYCKFQVNSQTRKSAEDQRSESEGRREARRSRMQGPAQIESVALCACRRHLRIISTL